jgi:hypothetical protein
MRRFGTRFHPDFLALLRTAVSHCSADRLLSRSRNDMKTYLPPSRLTFPERTCVESSAAPNIDMFFANITVCRLSRSLGQYCPRRIDRDGDILRPGSRCLAYVKVTRE